MSTYYDKASLVMIPSGVKEDKLYSIKPTDGTGDFTFSRDADIQATRVNASGLIEKAKVNLCLYSNTFDDASWSSINTTETSGQTGYDGSSDAWLLAKFGSSARVQQSVIYSGVNTWSVYVKAGSLNWVMLNNGSNNAWFDLQNGVVGTLSGGIDSSIESIGSGWYRCSLTDNLSSGSVVRIYPSQADNDLSGTSGNILIQDAQLNYGLVAQDYVDTTIDEIVDPSDPMRDALVKVQGLTADLPRLDYHNPDSPTPNSCPSLLLEPSRTNAFAHSEYSAAIEFNNVNSITNNAAISPEGVQNALEIDATGNDIADSYRNVGSGVVATFSVFAKAGTGDRLILNPSSTGSNATATYDLTEGTISSTGFGQYIDSDIENYGNGWWRCSITFTTGTGSYINRIRFVDTGTYQLYGFQLEAGNYVSSYIPTYGTAAVRGGEDIETATLPAISGGEVSFFLDIDGAYDPNANSTSSNFRWAFTSGFVTWNNNGSSNHRIRVTSALGNEYFTAAVNRDSRCKIVALLTATEAKVYANGVLVGTKTISADWSTANFIDTAITNSVGQVPIKQCLLFPTRLTDAEAIALTTI